jgi:hypothetical protein
LIKKQRYSNPFRFYLTASILFFFILRLSKSIDTFEVIKEGTPKKKAAFVSLCSEKIKKIGIISRFLLEIDTNQQTN